MPKRKWKLSKLGNNVHELRFDLPKVGDAHRTLWLSDLHWDNPKCDWALLKRHMDQAVEADAPIIVVGDFFCCMQGKYDKRSDKSSLRPEHMFGDYLDKLVSTAIEWFEPYKDHLAIVGEGNHESSIRSRHETDLLDRFCAGLRQAGGIAMRGGYNGWVRNVMKRAGSLKTFDFHYAHGAGGGAPVTKGAIDFNRWREQVTADAYIAGHIHRRNYNEQVVMSLGPRGALHRQQVDYVRCSTYKDDYDDGSHGWHNERQGGPRPLGGWWCDWTLVKAKPQTIFARQWKTTDSIGRLAA